MKFTIVGEWYHVEDLAFAFVVVAEGNTYGEAVANAAPAVLERFPQRAEGEDGETPETLWGGSNGAYVVAVFEGDLSAQAIDRYTFELIA
ncbi:hypothetical protein ACWD4T_31470 [Streptomyces umbrinus]